VFLPRPRVSSSLVEITRRDQPAVSAPFADMFALIRQGFATRRKMLRRALDGVAVNEDFVAANVDPQARAEQLAIDDWSRLTLAVNARLALIKDTVAQ
jgi:16S rRNA (adenine1518-N6/adenine1519-N6)-dimethyltransferase